MEPTNHTPENLPAQQPETAPAADAPQEQAAAPKADTPVLHKIVTNLQRGANDGAAQPQNGKIPAGAVWNALGQLFYRVGQQTEYAFVRAGRRLRRILRALRSGAVALTLLFLLPVLRFFGLIVQDLTEPFRRFARGLRNAYRAAQEGEGSKDGLNYLKSGVKAYRYLVGNALRYLMPLGAAAVLVFTVHQVLSYDYSLAVEYNGQMLGFIENENVWESAENYVRERIIASDESARDWTAEPTFSIRPIDAAARSTAFQLADDIIASASDEIQNATGVHINGELLGVATDGQAIQDVLNQALAPYQESQNENHRVEFAQDVQLVPGVYFTSSIEGTDTLIDALYSNPDYLKVKTIDVVEYDEEIAYTTEEVESDDYYTGVRKVIQAGRNGTQHVVAEVTSIDGQEVSRVPLQVTVTEEMTPRIVAVGTQTPPTTSITGSGVLVFPVPDYVGISTRFGQGGHRGVDLRAPYGAPIYACDSGTVVEAGWHYSWGNYVKIDHGNGMATLYAHCSSLAVSAGQGVARGQVIGYVGSTGYSSGNHCHLELYIGGSLTDPMAYIS
ncbi:peptidoglycan DD-metalloendopeptidase family protein [Ruthenibacterium sp. CLA-JM-H11]|uniref:Peptidoglycan DD-metalloendopeptidase family protein n=1 Tax=Ruthenibacterium intestinale TaxID=3133163 RepID=A0ABV1GCP6_9FIRM